MDRAAVRCGRGRSHRRPCSRRSDRCGSQRNRLQQRPDDARGQLPKKKVEVPMTVKLYEVGEKNAVGEQLGEAKKTFAMTYRPSDDTVHCTEGRWYDAAENTCYHGLAFKVKFSGIKVLRLPKRVIVGLSYNTTPTGRRRWATKTNATRNPRVATTTR
jgi:hypothetical protein